ncbi:S-adenosylmethionine tRNA ribosyltransferase [Mycolicibacterium aromaticivorans JS19b1 = JCM 16368]|uniref:S-adenosylmethionine tRNA ribosyltransferase n=1 Tax=Mycolicibacterium aromaticivorans JS19b1 = JCM 16368 TaxID=1440774 RepID=A0A064CPG7_9MYCO|nr:DUF3253 domain-containing protein [Mycolicibacterium aromaticivorans]KDF00619.1 S-adenosylmethionine tRNA ribosyltransferase [Mycolicibacterium aromaticivorans JS19b1 = JCM 16368]
MTDVRGRLRAAILTMTAERAPRTICPSDAARAVDAEHWRELMNATRELARELARTGDVVITQKGAVLDPDVEWRGPVRIGRLRG